MQIIDKDTLYSSVHSVVAIFARRLIFVLAMPVTGESQ